MAADGGWRALYAARDLSAYYRMWHVRQRAGLPYPDEPSPHPPPPFAAALLRLGEESGHLEECLRLLAEYFAAEHRLVLTVLRKATYPFFTGVLATFVAPLPLLVFGQPFAYALTVGAGLAGWALFGGGALHAISRWYLQKPAYVLGRLLRALTIAIEAGLPLGRAVPLAAQATGSATVLAHVQAQGARVLGQPLAATFRGCPLVPREALAALEVADVSGDYQGALRRLADLVEGSGAR